MIIMDPPRIDFFRNRPILTAHVLSTLHGSEGTDELTAFVKGIGMRVIWIQNRDTCREHFDLMGKRCQAAIDAGAAVDRRLVALTIGEKRVALNKAAA